MRTPPLLADFIHPRNCKPICEKLLTLPMSCSKARSLPEVKYIGGRLLSGFGRKKSGVLISPKGKRERRCLRCRIQFSMCHYLGGGLHGRKKRVKAQSESSKSVVNSVLISREMPVFPGFLEIIRVVHIIIILQAHLTYLKLFFIFDFFYI